MSSGSLPTAAAGRAVHPLSRAESLDRLAAGGLGRVVLTTPAGRPLIRPVNFAFDRRTGAIVFRSDRGAKFSALARDRAALFEVDAYDPVSGHGWSVIVTGVSEAVTHAPEIARLAQLDLGPAPVGALPYWFRIRPRAISGRRVGARGPRGGR